MPGGVVMIADVVSAGGQGGFCFDDQLAIRHGAAHEGFDYQGPPETAGFERIRQSAECVSVL